MSNKNVNTKGNNEVVIENKYEDLSAQAQHNLRVFNQGRSVPKSAQKEIEGGNLKGFTDINPVWRIEKLTEIFGPCGEGWYYEKIKEETKDIPNGSVLYFVDINLFYKMDNGEWSKGIFGTGGSTLVTTKTTNSGVFFYCDDDGKKKALTDAISVACKALGIAADIYYAKDETKYGALGSFTPVQIPMLPTVETMNEITDDGGNISNNGNAVNGNMPSNAKMPDAMAAVNAAIHSQVNNANVQPEAKKFIRIDPATTPVPTLEQAEGYIIGGNGQWTGQSLGQVFRLAMSGDGKAQYWLNWLNTADTTSENIAWAQFYANFLNNHYRQMAQGQGTANNNANA